MTRLRVIVGGMALDEQERARIAEAGDGLDLVFAGQEGVGAHLATADAATGRLSDAELAGAEHLRWNHLWSAGADAALTPAMRASDVLLTASLGNGGIPLAEHAILLLLLLDRGGWRWARAQDAHRWDPFPHGELAGRTLGLLGLGTAGAHLAAIGHGMGMRVLGVSRRALATPNVDEVFPVERLTEMLAQTDALVVTAPLTDATRGMLGDAEFAALRPGALYVNVSRGEVADEEALRRAVLSGHLGGAGLDAHAHEPLPADDPWWTTPGVLVTPHSGSNSPESKARSIAVLMRNLRLFRDGDPLENVVDKTTGY